MSEIGRLRTTLQELLAEHERDGALLDLGRFLFYELVLSLSFLFEPIPTPTPYATYPPQCGTVPLAIPPTVASRA